MSMMRCVECDRAIDTDYDLVGEWGDTTYTCTACCEQNELDEITRASVALAERAKERP